MTKDEFINNYMECSRLSKDYRTSDGFSVEGIVFTAEPCKCGDETCEGWQMTRRVCDEAKWRVQPLPGNVSDMKVPPEVSDKIVTVQVSEAIAPRIIGPLPTFGTLNFQAGTESAYAVVFNLEQAELVFRDCPSLTMMLCVSVPICVWSTSVAEAQKFYEVWPTDGD